ncbi:MAG: GatB/YqeY domain-containing protein [Deltaproteobacteria bacterium]|nr:GatB/YqeY domain-containing protein [Deltaproteobacteria bacterium]
MSLKEKIRQDMVSATKSRDLVALSTLRMLLASLKNREIELLKEADDAEVMKIIATSIKQRKESVEFYDKGGRKDLVEKETREIEVLEAYLPPQMNREDLVSLIEEIISEVGALGVRDIGKVMKNLMPRVTGRADGKEVSDLVREILSKE